MLSPNFTFINQSKGDKSYNNNNYSSHQSQQQFKVQRSPDGKLNLVVNDVIVYLQRPISAQQTPTTTNKDFVYPSDRSKPQGAGKGVSTRLNLPEAPLCAEDTGKSFCTKVANYPDVANLEGLLKNDLQRFEPFFGEDLPQPQNISQRINDDPIEEPLCDSQSRIIYPEAGTTRDNVETFIVNLPTYKQGVRIEECSNRENECKYTDSFPNGYKTKCKQHYIFRQMVVFTQEGGAVKKEIKLPSCCMCVVINT